MERAGPTVSALCDNMWFCLFQCAAVVSIVLQRAKQHKVVKIQDKLQKCNVENSMSSFDCLIAEKIHSSQQGCE